MSISFANLISYAKKNLINILLYAVVILSILLVLSVSRCSHNSDKAQEYERAVKYLNDTVQRYEDRLGRETAEKGLLEASRKALKKANKDLYEELKVERGTKLITKTLVRYETDTLYRDSHTHFSVLSDSVLSDISFDLGTIIVGYDDKRRLFAKSTNPNVKIDSLDGVLLAEKPRRLGIGVFFGPSISYGVLGRDIDFGFSIGVGLTWRIKK